MAQSLRFLIRDGLEGDIPGCLELDHTVRAEHVWQMNVKHDTGQWQMAFKTERLPRPVEVEQPKDEPRLRAMLNPEHSFLVVVQHDTPQILGYLTLRHDLVERAGLIQSVVVDNPLRRQRIGSRLLNIARQWAQQRGLQQLTAAISTKNYPAIRFFEKAGYTFCGFHDQYYENRDIAVFFGIRLR